MSLMSVVKSNPSVKRKEPSLHLMEEPTCTEAIQEVRQLVIKECYNNNNNNNNNNKEQSADQVWKRALQLDDWSQVPKNVQFEVVYTPESSHSVVIPQELAEQIVKLTCFSDRRTMHIEGASRLPNLTSLILTDALVLPRFPEVVIPVEFCAQNNRCYASYITNNQDSEKGQVEPLIGEAKDEDAETNQLLPYKDVGRLMYPVLHDLEMGMYQLYGLHAGIQSLGTMSHLDGTLSLFVRDVGSWLHSSVDTMHQFLRFPNVKVLRLRYWQKCRNPYGQVASAENVSEESVAYTWNDIRLLLHGLFGNYEQRWSSLERIELDLLSEVGTSGCSGSSNSGDSNNPSVQDGAVPLKYVLLHYFPRHEWSTVIDRSPKLNSIGYWCRFPDQFPAAVNRKLAEIAVAPFLYSLEVQGKGDERRRRNDQQIQTILQNSAAVATVDKNIVRRLVRKCDVSCRDCCRFGNFQKFKDYSKTWQEWQEEERCDEEANRAELLAAKNRQYWQPGGVAL
jgi:hypothetical protein